MNIAIPASLNPRQRAEDTRGLVLTAPSVHAPATDDRATVIELNGTEHRVPHDWSLAEAKHGESDIAILRRGSDVRVLVGDREGRIHEVKGYSQDVRRSILEHRFGEPSQQSSDEREVDRLVALSDSLEGGSIADNAEADRLAKVAAELA